MGPNLKLNFYAWISKREPEEALVVVSWDGDRLGSGGGVSALLATYAVGTKVTNTGTKENGDPVLIQACIPRPTVSEPWFDASLVRRTSRLREPPRSR